MNARKIDIDPENEPVQTGTAEPEPSTDTEAEGGAEALEVLQEAAEEVAEAAEEKEALRDRFLRLQADFDNYRKRVQRERGELYQRANEDLVTELLPVIDHLEMGLKVAAKSEVEKSVMDGFELVYGQLLDVLEKFGLTQFDAEGQVFDPHLHEAITHVPSEEHPTDAVIAQTRRGYRLGKKLLRAAQVVISCGSVGEEGDAGDEKRDHQESQD